MARGALSSKSEAKSDAYKAERGFLPLPELVIQHHGKTISPLMREWWTQKRIPPVLLITGPSGVGKRSIAYFLAQWIFCEKTGLNRISSDEDAVDSGMSLFGDAPETKTEAKTETKTVSKPESKPAGKPLGGAASASSSAGQ